MKVLIVRLWAEEMNINNYNCQEIGLAKSLIKKGHTCDIVLYTKGKNRKIEYQINEKKIINIYYLKAVNILHNCIYNKKIFDIIKNYDVIQSAEYDQIFNLKLFEKLRDKLVIYHGPYRSNYTKGYKIKCLISDFIYLFFKKYKKVKCITKSKLATTFLKEKKFENIYTIGVGLDTDRICSTKYEQKYKNLFNNDSEYLLYVGKIENRRNINFLIDVYLKCKEKRKNIKLIIIGDGVGKYYKKIIKRIAKIDGIIYKNKVSQSQLSEFYEKSTLFLLPTNYEIFGMVLLESMFFSLPVLTTLNGGSSMLIDNNKNGYILPLNPDKWAQTILNYIDSSNKSMTQNCKNVIMKTYNWDQLAKSFIDVYQKKI